MRNIVTATLVWFSIVQLITVPNLWGGQENTDPPLPSKEKIVIQKQLPQAFAPGENLEFVVSWLGINAGKSFMRVDHPEKLGNIPVWPLRSGAQTSGFIRRLYVIDNDTTSFIEPYHCRPLRFEVDQFSGGQKETIFMTFMQKEGKVFWQRTYKSETKKGSAKVVTGIQDSVSSIYYLRNQKLKPGDKIKIPVYAGRKKWMLEAHVIKREKVKVPAGTFNALKIKPVMLPESEGKPKGTMTLWFTDDTSHIPVRIKSEVPVGSVLMELKKLTKGTLPERDSD